MYVQQNLFGRAGMPDSRYCSNSAVVARRAHRYDVDDGRFTLAKYIDFTWPYSADALCSTAGDWRHGRERCTGESCWDLWRTGS